MIDANTSKNLPPEERGELVLRHVRKDGVPLVRFWAGDYADVEVRDREVVLPGGIIGRTDDRLKIKGVKVNPESLDTVLAGSEGLTGEYQLEVHRPDSSDNLALVLKGEADVEEVSAAVAEQLLISPDGVKLVGTLDDPDIADERY